MMTLPPLFRRIVSHAAVAVLGGALWWGWTSGRESSPVFAGLHERPAENPRTATRAAVEARLAELDRWDEPVRHPPKSAAEQMKNDLEEGAKANAEKQKRFAGFLSLADTYRGIPDLRPILADALAAAENQAATAIFLEWHRRDPRGAFDELAKLPAWSMALCDDSAVLLGIPAEEMIAELANPSRVCDLRLSFAYWDALHLAESDDLSNLARACASLDEDLQRELLVSFLQEWIPDDTGAPVRFLAGIDESFRRTFLTALAEGNRMVSCGVGAGIGNFPPSFPYPAWSDALGAALSATNLGSCEDLRPSLTAQLKQALEPVVLTDYPMVPTPAKKYAVPAGDPGQISAKIGEYLDQLLFRDCDYPGLLESGQTDLPAIHAAMLATMPGVEDHAELLASALFERLVQANPQASLEWARGVMSAEEIARSSTQVLETSEEPRLSHLGELLAVLPTNPVVGDGIFPRTQRSDLLPYGGPLQDRFKSWQKLGPEAAADRLSRIPARSALTPGEEEGHQ